MRKHLLLIGAFVAMCASAQDFWTAKASFGGSSRSFAVGFSIGTKGYVGTGRSSGGRQRDFWEYDPVTNVWTQKASVGSAGRDRAVGFSIGSKGYIGTGYDGSNRKDFWEYDPTANTWTQKTDFGGTARFDAVGFSMGGKGYIGTGDDGSYRKDFWEYDPATDTWTQKTDFGGSARIAATGFSISGKGYVGTGGDTGYARDFWEYDPATNAWTRKADFGGIARDRATGFTIGSKGYLGIGVNAGIGHRQDFWEYDPAADTWTLRASFGGGNRAGSVSFSIGNKGYLGLGDSGGSPGRDLWEYTLCADPAFSDQPDAVSVCSGNTVSFGVVASGLALTYQWQVKAAAGGSFSNISNGSVYLNATTNTLSVAAVTGLDGAQYQCVVSSGACISTSNAALLTVHAIPDATITAATGACAGSSGNAISVPDAGVGASYSWGATTGGVVDNPGSSSTTYTAGTGAVVSLSVSVTTPYLCAATGSLVVNVNSVTPGIVDYAGGLVPTGGDPVAFGEGMAATGTGSLSYQWQQSSTSGSGFSDISLATGSTYDVPAGLMQTTFFRRVVTSTTTIGCSAISNEQMVEVGSPEITVSGNGLVITDGTTVPDAGSGTSFGEMISGSLDCKVFTISNAGGSSPLVISSIGVTGAGAPFFRIVSSLPLPVSIAAGGPDVTFTVCYTAIGAGARSGMISITSNDADEGTYTFGVNGKSLVGGCN